MRPAIRNLGNSQRGTAAIEMALVAPILATLLIGMVDLGRGYSIKLVLEQASQRAIEKVMNGQADKTTVAALKTEAATVAVVPEANVSIDFWLECGGVRQANYTSTCSSGAIYRRYLTVRIQKTFTPIFSTRWAGANANGTYTVTGKTGVRTQ